MSQRVVIGRITKPCETCGAPVTRKNSAFKPHVYCSKKCSANSAVFLKQLAERNGKKYPNNRLTRPCLNCGTRVERPKSQFNGRTFCSRPCRTAYRAATTTRQIQADGYARIFVGKGAPGATKSGHILEHRHVMQEHLGRALLAEENVHHKNGNRVDNGLENLELWSRSQPSGQRVEDKLAWAREFIELYEGLLPTT